MVSGIVDHETGMHIDWHFTPWVGGGKFDMFVGLPKIRGTTFIHCQFHHSATSRGNSRADRGKVHPGFGTFGNWGGNPGRGATGENPPPWIFKTSNFSAKQVFGLLWFSAMLVGDFLVVGVEKRGGFAVERGRETRGPEKKIRSCRAFGVILL